MGTSDEIKRPVESMLSLLKSDFAADRRNPKGLLICALYRIAQACVNAPPLMRPIAILYIILYKIVTECVLGTEIHWRAKIGPSLRVYHGYGLVVNSGSILGARVVLRHGVTIGSKSESAVGAPVVGDDVDFGASAIVIGEITIGSRSIIGAGAVVTKNVPSDSIVVGNPARILQNTRPDGGEFES